MNTQSDTPAPLINWQTLAMWFGRALLALAVYYGKELLATQKDQTAAMVALAQSQQETRIEMANISRELRSKTALRWTQVDQRLWAGILAQKNPGIIVPEPTHVELPEERQ